MPDYEDEHQSEYDNLEIVAAVTSLLGVNAAQKFISGLTVLNV